MTKPEMTKKTSTPASRGSVSLHDAALPSGPFEFTHRSLQTALRAWVARLGGVSVALLWFIGVYLLVLAFVPALMRCGAAALGGIVVALLAASALVDGARLATGAIEWGFPNFLVVWLIPVVIGVAYARRMIPARFALAAAAVAFVADDRPHLAAGVRVFPLLLAGFVLLFFQGLSEIIKKIAIMRGLIADPHAEGGPHGAAEVVIDPELLAETGFASPDHPVTDEMIDHPLDHNRNATDAAAGRTARAPGTRPDGGPRE